MSNSANDDVLGKLDALIKRHQPSNEVEIPVLTDMVAQPEIDLDEIPMLTEVFEAVPSADVALPTPPAMQDDTAPYPELAPLELTPPVPDVADPSALASAKEPLPALEFELPPDARYVPLDTNEEAFSPAVEIEPPSVPVIATPPQALSEEAIQHIASIIKDDVATVLDSQLQQALAQQLQSSLHVALDKALSSMLDQFTTTIEEVVRASIADELQKQLAPFKRPAPPKS